MIGSKRGQGGQTQSADGPMKKILVIEGGAEMRRNLTTILRLEKFHPLPAENGRVGSTVLSFTQSGTSLGVRPRTANCPHLPASGRPCDPTTVGKPASERSRSNGLPLRSLRTQTVASFQGAKKSNSYERRGHAGSLPIPSKSGRASGGIPPPRLDLIA